MAPHVEPVPVTNVSLTCPPRTGLRLSSQVSEIPRSPSKLSAPDGNGLNALSESSMLTALDLGRKPRTVRSWPRPEKSANSPLLRSRRMIFSPTGRLFATLPARWGHLTSTHQLISGKNLMRLGWPNGRRLCPILPRSMISPHCHACTAATRSRIFRARRNRYCLKGLRT